MAFAGVAGADARELQRHDFAVEQRDQPAHRAHEALGRLAAPVHVLRPVDAGDFFRQRFGQNVGAARPFFCTVAARYSPLGVVIFSSASTGTFTLRAKASAAGVGVAIFVGDLQRRAGHLLADVGLRDGDSGCQHGQPSRRGVRRASPGRSPGARAASSSPTRRASSSRALSIIRAGISSVPISRRKSIRSN